MARNALIVDDSGVMRKIVMRNLRNTQVHFDHIFEAGDGIEGLKVLEGNEVAVIFSDVNMPNMGGLEMVKQIKAQYGTDKIKIIMVTTDGAEETIKEAMDNGASGYIKKPFTPEQMVKYLQDLL
ncbi:MAG: response regulator [Deltaproteobacteria bacterium]|nr:response regulator [Deltaproteobacteria bacterium]